ncbi:MAG: hypothetical protein HQL46_05695 [Gammaproteobacteria bacterium]|nr:hypothetical protein [Gammaproteobacteria bacterium]
MPTILSFSQAQKNKQFQLEQQRSMQLLELKMNDTLANIEEFQYLAFCDLELMGIDSFEIIPANELNSKRYLYR